MTTNRAAAGAVKTDRRRRVKLKSKAQWLKNKKIKFPDREGISHTATLNNFQELS